MKKAAFINGLRTVQSYTIFQIKEIQDILTYIKCRLAIGNQV